MRPCPDSAALKLAFTRSDRRMLRKSDGTIVIEGRRFEVPNRYRHLPSLEVRFASWDGLRRALEPIATAPVAVRQAVGLPPLLARLMRARAATGLAPAYLVKDDEEGEEQ